MNKLKALFIGNCQTGGVINYLLKSKEFSQTYETKLYANWELIANKSSIPMFDVESADLFVYQPLRPVHGCYSTDPNVQGSIGYYLKDSCIKISFPYVYSSAMWPIVQTKQNENRWWGGEVIDELVSEGISYNEIISLFLENKIDWKYKKRFQSSINILKQKETITDVKVAEFIEKNLKDNLLFLIPHHPTSIIFLNIANQILEKLNMGKLSVNVIGGINDRKLEDTIYNLPTCMFPLHKSSIIDYNLNYGKEYLENSDNFYVQRIKNYLETNHPCYNGI